MSSVVRVARPARPRLRVPEERRLAREDPLAPQAVERLVPRRPDDPRARARGDALDGPALGRDGEGLLHGLLGAVEVPDEPDEAREDASGLLAEEAVEVHGRKDYVRPRTGLPRGHIFWMGLTSIEPMRAEGMRAASAMASSRSFASTR